MLKRIPVAAALAALTLTVTLCACGGSGGGTGDGPGGVGAGASLSVPTSTRATSSASARPSTSPTPTTSARASSPPALGGQPIIFAVRLDTAFQPGALRLSPGQQFEVFVASSVSASGPALPSTCTGTSASVYNGMLSVRCQSGTFYYTAQKAGSAELMATVRPRCSPGTMCPQWMAEATLKITIL
jgi:hypothetical protein